MKDGWERSISFRRLEANFMDLLETLELILDIVDKVPIQTSRLRTKRDGTDGTLGNLQYADVLGGRAGGDEAGSEEGGLIGSH
jgi:hypothetical protein